MWGRVALEVAASGKGRKRSRPFTHQNSRLHHQTHEVIALRQSGRLFDGHGVG